MQEQFQVVHYLLEPGEVVGPGKMLRDWSGLERVLEQWRQTAARPTDRAGMLSTRAFLSPESRCPLNKGRQCGTEAWTIVSDKPLPQAG